MEQPDAITLNNHGAWSITCGNYDYAIKILSTAIKCLRASNNEEAGSPTIVECNLHRFMADDHDNNDLDISNDKIQTDHADDFHSVLHQQRFIHQKPIEIPSWYSQLPGSQSNTTVTTTIIFNLALAYHLSGVTTIANHTTCVISATTSSSTNRITSQTRSRLTTAATLYEQSLVMNWMKREEEAWAPHFLLATLNNLGQVYDALGHRETSEKWNRRLLQCLMLFSDVSVGQLRDMEGFFGSVTHLIFRESPAPAAAA